MIKPKMLEKAAVMPRDAKAILKDYYKRQHYFVKNQSNQSSNQKDTRVSPTNYAIECVDNSANFTTMSGYSGVKKVKQYAYKKYNHRQKAKGENNFDNSFEATEHATITPQEQIKAHAKREAQSATQNQSDTTSVPKTDSRIKTKEYYVERQNLDIKNSTPSHYRANYRSPIKEKQIKLTKKINITSIKQKSIFNKPPTISVMNKAIVQGKRKAQKKMLIGDVKRTIHVAKATVNAATKLTVRLAQTIVASTKALVSVLVALGGPAILLVVLTGIIIISAVAASPFGIFISEDAHDVGSIPLSAIVAECNNEFAQKMEKIENDNTYDVEEIEGEQADWADVLAVFAVKTAGVEDDTAQDVVIFDEAKKALLKNVFWDMNSISSRTKKLSASDDNTQTVLYISITNKTSDDMIRKYNFSLKQQEALATLLDNRDVLLSATKSLAITDASVTDVIKNLSSTLPEFKKQVVKTACSLVGKVNYFWGGKSSSIGWDSNWGKMMKVTATGSTSTGTIRPFGLDCSGFVTWTFINSKKDVRYANVIGNGATNQYSKCTPISWSNAEPGDLAFYADLSHVGIVVGKDINGNTLVIHCAGGYNNVVLTTNSGFALCARPNGY